MQTVLIIVGVAAGVAITALVSVFAVVTRCSFVSLNNFLMCLKLNANPSTGAAMEEKMADGARRYWSWNIFKKGAA